MYYAQINLTTRIVEAETMPHSPIDAPHMIEVSAEQYGTLLGKRHDQDTGAFVDVPVVVPVVPQHATKRAFQNRFPTLANGVSTKWDAMCLFLSDDGYAASLGVSGAGLYGLRMLITTGVQRLNASPFVDMDPSAEAAGLTALLMNASIPADFRLTAGERETMLDTPLADGERFKG